MSLTTDALIIRTNDNVGESDRFITALTKERGVIRASVRGARNIKNKNGSATQLLGYTRLSLTEGKSHYIVQDAQPLSVFFDLRRDLTKLSLAQYFCELAGVLAPQEQPAGEHLRLLLNALHYLSAGTRPPQLIKAVVELRLLCAEGYTPALSACAVCGKSDHLTRFSPLRGTVTCDTCARAGTLPLTPSVWQALRHITTCPPERCFAFSLAPESLEALSDLSERFLLAQVNRGFSTLSFYHSLAQENYL